MLRLLLLTLVSFSLAAGMFASSKPKAQKAAKTPPPQSTSSAPPQNNSPTSYSPNTNLTVSVVPGAAQVSAGSTQQFSATVTGSTNQSVLWSISGVGCQALSCGSINGSGLYTAPANAPNAPVITINALAFADFSTSGKASVTITGQGTPPVTVTPAAVQLNPGGQQQFTVSTGTLGSQLSWSVSGIGCGYNCGTITPNGLYTAPNTVPSPNIVTVTAQTGIFPVYKASSQVTILGSNSTGSLTVSPLNVQLGAGGQQTFTASSNGMPTSSVNWSLSGVGCSGSGCGTISSSGQYFAPATIPAPAVVTIAANSVFTGKYGSATVNLSPAIAISINPPNAQVSTGSQQQFSAAVTNTSNTSVAWSVSCASNSCGTVSPSGLFTAPATIPFLNTVSVTATSLADLTKKASATVNIISATAAIVSISPSANVQVNAGTQQQFSAAVVGPSNTAVTWSVGGQGCIGSSCGTITSAGLFTAPIVPPPFNAVTVTATSQANPSASASVTVSVLQVIGITLSPWISQVTSGSQEQFVATVTGTPNSGVNWGVSGSACQFPGACGTISSSGLYLAPSGVTSPLTVTITATAQANPTKTVSASITVVPPVVVTVSPPIVTASVNSQQQYIATVTGTSNTAVQWSISGPGCSGSTCGSIVSTNGNTVTYQAPASIPTPATVSVTATSVSTPTKSSSASITIVSTNNNKLNGQYSFQFSGLDGAVTYQAIGSFTADGNGNITNGLEDINCGPAASDVICGSAPVAAMTFSGTYNLNADNRGTLTVSNSLGTFTFSMALATVTGDLRFIETDNSTVRGSGVMKPQVRSDFVPSPNQTQMFGNSPFALGLSGVDASGGRVGMLGSMIMGRGTLLDGTLRINDRGSHCTQGVPCLDTTYLLPASGPNLQGTFTLDSTTGRGSLTITAPGYGAGVLNLTMYVVSATDYFVVSSDPVPTTPLLSGEGLQQQLPASDFFFQTGTSIISWDALNGGVADAAVGSISFSVVGLNVNVSHFIFDENNGGVITLYNVVCPTCGFLYQGNNEELLTGISITSFHLFPYALNSAFVLGSTSSVQFGRIESQSPTIASDYAFGSDGLVDPATPLVAGTEYLGVSGLTGNEDLSQISGFANNLALNGSWNVSGGEFNTSLTMPPQQQFANWVVSYSKAISMQVDSGSVPSLIILEH